MEEDRKKAVVKSFYTSKVIHLQNIYTALSQCLWKLAEKILSHPINLRASLITTDVEVDQWHCLISEQLPISSKSKMIRVSVVCEISLMLCHFLEHHTCYISIPDCYLAAAISSQAFIKFSFGDCSDYLRVPFFSFTLPVWKNKQKIWKRNRTS